MKKSLTFLLWFMHLLSYPILLLKIEPFIHFSYIICWWTFILALNQTIKLKADMYSLRLVDLPSLILISAAYWSLFELINLRIENWFYVNINENLYVRYLGYFVAYGTVIPGILLVRNFLQTFYPIYLSGKKLDLRGISGYFLPLGIFLFFLLVLIPQFLFPLTWIFPIFLLEGINGRLGIRSYTHEISQGDYTNLLYTLFSGIICGFLWEAWNFPACAKWIYTVPFFEEKKIFEMPILGYLGFPFFAVSTLSFYNLFQGLKYVQKRIALILSLFVMLITFPQIDKGTVFSFRVKIDDLYFVPQERREKLKDMGYETIYGLDESLLQETERERVRLVNLSGFGIENLKKLERYKIHTIEELSQLDEKELQKILEEKNVRRVRFYLREAKKRLISSRTDLSGSKRSKL